MSQQQQGGAAASAGTPGTSSTAAHQGQGKGSAGLQGVTQVSLLGQIPAELLDQVLRRLRGHCEHEERFELHEDVLTRGFHDPSGPLREEDVIRIRGLTVHNSKSKDSDTDKGQTEWSLNAFSRPLPVRENGQVLIRSIASTPVLDGNAGALAVALGYSERKFSYKRKGHRFTNSGGLCVVQIFQVYNPPESNDPLDTSHYVIEVLSYTAHRPTSSVGAPAMQSLREQAIQRALHVKRVLKGLVDLSRVE